MRGSTRNKAGLFADTSLKPKPSLNGAPVGLIRIMDAVRCASDYLAITTVVQELLSLGRSRFAAVRISSRGRSFRMIGQ